MPGVFVNLWPGKPGPDIPQTEFPQTTLDKLQDTNLICPPLVCQYAALAAD
ncbi:MAG: hypothetical protein O6928_06090 [Gammaproteobacteria bacterium]|nr:hypothetical protein [Gammaproteobacteria bacterium]